MTEQRTEEWHQQRAGRITASRFADAIAISKRTGEPTEARNKYLRELVAEILMGNAKHSISSKSMQWGTEVEAYAREAYELHTGNLVVESEFLLHPQYDYIGASPDGLIWTDGGLEMKCPHDEQVHIKTWLEGMPADHIGQVQGCMYVTGRQWWDFVSYDPRQSEPYRLYVQRIPRDEAYIANLETGLLAFWQEVQQAVTEIQRKAA
jgi:putative phage-type endonuclease